MKRYILCLFLALSSCSPLAFASPFTPGGVPRAITGTQIDTNGVIYDNGTNVGIGSTVPSAKLDINGTVKASAFAGDGSGLTNLPAKTWGSIGGTLANQTDLNNALGSKISGINWGDVGGTLGNQTDLNNAFTAKADLAGPHFTGNVGIGSTAPRGPLDIPGTIYTGLTASRCVQTASDGSLTVAGGVCGTGGGMTYPSAGIALSTGTAWDTPITNNSANWNTAYGWGNHASAGYAALSGPHFTGNVGIGSSVPTKALDVVGTVKATAFIGDGSGLTGLPASATGANPTGTAGLSAVNGSASTFLRSDGAPALSQAISPTWTGNHVFSPSSGNTLFSAGNVGIGSTVPSAKLDINGTVKASAFSGDGSGLTNLPASSQWTGTTSLYFNGNVAVGTTAAATNSLSVTGAANFTGNIGIGTTAPGNSLVIKATPAVIDVNYITSGQGGCDALTNLLLHMDGANNGTTFTDENCSGSGAKTATVGGSAVTSTGVKKFGTASGYFEGTTSYISFADSADWYFSTGSFTIDFWVYFSASQNAYQMLAGQSKSGDANDYWRFMYRTDTHVLEYIAATGGTTMLSMTVPFTASDATWYHIALVRNVNSWDIYINGVAQSKTLVGGAYTNAIGDIAAPLVIGKFDRVNDYFVKGYIDEFRVSKGIARFTSNFSVASSPYDNSPAISLPELRLIGNSSAKWSVFSDGNNADNFAIGLNNTTPKLFITSVGNVGIGTASPRKALDVVGDVYVSGDMSALSITDRTPFYNGDALAEIQAIEGTPEGIDHDTLPEFAKGEYLSDEGPKVGRNIGNMLSMLTVAVQQLNERMDQLKGQVEIQTGQTVQWIEPVNAIPVKTKEPPAKEPQLTSDQTIYE